MISESFWRGKRVFITGHTGFKGSWLSLWLRRLGAEVTGYSLAPPTQPSLYELAGVGDLIDAHHGDVRDLPALAAVMSRTAPDIVLHLAAQSLVRHSYRDPVETFTTNIVGSTHVLEAIRGVPSVRAAVMVTSDKCYHNEEWVWGYREDSRLGGDDPYSASKAAAEMVIAAYQHSFFGPASGRPLAVASARAGNVIGGGDWATDRLVPDVIRSLLAGEATIIRNPGATRPWQHVLEPLHGYLTLAEHLWADGRPMASGWNFGPGEDSERSVGWIVAELHRLWNVERPWVQDANPGPAEKTFLKLDSSKARAYLGWRPKLGLTTALQWIVDWTRVYQGGGDLRAATLADIERFMAIVPAA